METALITGASSGIGLELARCFARDRADVVLVARREEALQHLQRELQETRGVRAWVLPKDLAHPSAAREIAEAVEAWGLSIDALVNNAGFGLLGDFRETDWDAEDRMIAVNVRAPAHLTKRFLPGMLRRGRGRILNVASTAALQPGPGMAVYFAAKAFLLSFSEALAEELRGTGVSVTALCPGPTATGFFIAARMEMSGLVKDRLMPTAAEVAAYGYRAMRRGKTVAVPGLLNRLRAHAVRFAPRRLVARIARQVIARAPR